jgi:hypothetical protein
MEMATDFWRSLAAQEFGAAAELASFPFDMDGRASCVESAPDLVAAFEDQWQQGLVLQIGEATPVFAETDLSGLDEAWAELLPRWTADDAPCLGPAEVGGVPVVHHNFLVDFTVNDEAMGALTRVRCVGEGCGVAGVDN